MSRNMEALDGDEPASAGTGTIGNKDMTRQLRLEKLRNLAPTLTEVAAAFYKENCMVCLADQNHNSGVRMLLRSGEGEDHIAIEWEGTVTSHMKRSYRDEKKRVDFGACAVALLIMPEHTGYIAVEPSATGDGVDYYLTRPSDDDLIFNDAARLEVSGIQREHGSNTVVDRIRDKRRRLKKLGSNPAASPGTELPTYICVVEFGQPQSELVIA